MTGPPQTDYTEDGFVDDGNGLPADDTQHEEYQNEHVADPQRGDDPEPDDPELDGENLTEPLGDDSDDEAEALAFLDTEDTVSPYSEGGE